MKLLTKLIALYVGIIGTSLAHGLSPNLYGAIVESVKLVEDTTAGMTYVVVKVDQPLDSAVTCTVSQAEQTLRFVYDNQGDSGDNNSASLFLYTLLLTAKSSGASVDFVYRDLNVLGVPVDHCSILSARVSRS